MLARFAYFRYDDAIPPRRDADAMPCRFFAAFAISRHDFATLIDYAASFFAELPRRCASAIFHF